MNIILECRIINFDQKFFFITFLYFKSILLVLELAGYVDQYLYNWSFLFSGSLLVILAVILLFVFIRKYFLSILTKSTFK